MGAVAGAAFLALAVFRLDAFWLGIVTQAVIYSTIFLSITVVTGMAGQISLCQATFAGVGAFTTAQLVVAFGVPVLAGIAIGACLAAALGALVALPALRLGGIHLALATLAFALMFESVLVPLDWVGGGSLPLHVPRPLVGRVDFASDQSFFLLCLGVLVLVGIAVSLVRSGRTGRFLDSVRGSEVAAMSVGIPTARVKVTASALSAAIAGLGGGLLASQQHEANPARFVPFWGLFWVVLVVTLGSRTIEGAVNAGLALMLVPELLEALGVTPAFGFVLFGLGAITFARHPEGIVEAQKREAIGFVDRLVDRLANRRRGRSATAATEP